jgi:fructose-1,6-bisphosphatase
MKRKSTMIELVQELEKLKITPAIQEIIDEAKAGEYHDYKNNKYVCGKVAAVQKLSSIGLNELADQVRNGDYDEEADDQDKAYLKKIAIDGGFSEAQCKRLFGI